MVYLSILWNAIHGDRSTLLGRAFLKMYALNELYAYELPVLHVQFHSLDDGCL